jgi:hypothetical protein
MPRGRPPELAANIVRLHGSKGARQRLEWMLQTLAGRRSIPEATRHLGIGRSRLCLLRQKALQAALAALEPQARGRPPTQRTPQERQIAELQRQVQALKIDLRAAQIREQLALLMPHVLHRRNKRVKKNASPGRGQPQRRRGRAAPRPPARPATAADRSGDEA